MSDLDGRAAMIREVNQIRWQRVRAQLTLLEHLLSARRGLLILVIAGGGIALWCLGSLLGYLSTGAPLLAWICSLLGLVLSSISTGYFLGFLHGTNRTVWVLQQDIRQDHPFLHGEHRP